MSSQEEKGELAAGLVLGALGAIGVIAFSARGTGVSQVQSEQPAELVLHYLDMFTGEHKTRPAFGPGIIFTGGNGLDPNVTPTVAAPINTGSANYGTPQSPILAPLVPVRESGAGIDGLRDDPNPDKGLLSLKAEARRQRQQVATEFINSA